MRIQWRSLLLVVIAAVIGCGKSEKSGRPEVRTDGQGRIVIGDLVTTTEGENRSRVELLPTTPTEDARHILGEPPVPSGSPDAVDREYLPDPAVEWVIDVRFPGNPKLDPRAVSDAFDMKWRNEFGRFSEYGRDSATGRWTFLVSSDGPESVDQMKLGFRYVDILDPELPIVGEQQFVRRLEEVSKRLEKFGMPKVTAGLSPADAVQKSQFLRDIKKSLDRDAILILNAPAGHQFEGKALWDVMLCLGLHWGDMDCFHWRNASDVGDDSLFSVETSTPPGYFLPEEVAADRVHVDDLIFVFSIPRCGKPVEVFDAMSRAAEYCRTRLGGSIVDKHGKPVDVDAMRREIAEIVERLRQAGFEPGADATLQLF